MVQNHWWAHRLNRKAHQAGIRDWDSNISNTYDTSKYQINKNGQEWGESLKPDWIIPFLHCKGNKMKIAKLILNVLRLAVIVAGLYLIFFR